MRKRTRKLYGMELVPLPRPGMGAVVNLLQLRGGQLGIALRGGKPLVAEQFLYGAQVRALFQ